MKKIVTSSLVVLLALVLVATIVIASGAYNVAADEEHTAFSAWLLETARERSIAARKDDLTFPNLRDAERIRRGAGNYDAMCVSCHLAPGVGSTELSRGLYPTPPDLTKVIQTDPARAFWIIKHGLKATGMPAWGKSIEDAYIWDLVAFIQKLPEMSPQHYASEVAASGGHSHGGGENGSADGEGDEFGSEQKRPTDPPAEEQTHADGHSHTH